MNTSPVSPAVLDVVFCWHMHQPDYRLNGVYLKPWTWLHAIKDYSDMAAHLESQPAAHAVINFSAVLLEQIQDYAQRLRVCLDDDGPIGNAPIGDPLLDALAGAHPKETDQAELLRALLRVNADTMQDRFAPYALLHQKASTALAGDQALSPQELNDLLVWYVLVWLGESLRDESVSQNLATRQSGFTREDRRALLQLLARVLGDLIPRYRRLAESGQIELSLTPYAHPIMPLLLDVHSAREAMPGVALPAVNYPGGAERCTWHIAEAQSVFTAAFGYPAEGCWPSEGAISAATLKLLAGQGFRWTASGARVLFNSLSANPLRSQIHPHLQPWRLGAASPVTFFRDDELSDLIGFEYSKWPAADAVEDFTRRLEQRLDDWLEQGGMGQNAVLSIIMDGENAWEYFPRNGHAFLSQLYSRLSTHPRLRMKFFNEVLGEVEAQPLPGLRAGSWVHGNFSTWVGDPAKNRAWELLGRAKSAVDAALAPAIETAKAHQQPTPGWVQEVLQQLAVCEASDWFWWLGADNQLEDGPAFDQLFRQHLAALYTLIGMTPPDILSQSINTQSGIPEASTPVAGGAMRPAGDTHATEPQATRRPWLGK